MTAAAIRQAAERYIPLLQQPELRSIFTRYFRVAAELEAAGLMHEYTCDLFPGGRGDFRPFLDFRNGVKSVLGKYRELKAIIGSQQIAERQQHQHRYRLCTSKEEQVGMGADFWDISESWSRPYLASVKGSRQTNLVQTYFHSDWLLDKSGRLPTNMVDRLVIVNEDTDVIWSVDFSMMARLYDRRKLPSSHGVVDLKDLIKLRQPGERLEVIQLWTINNEPRQL